MGSDDVVNEVENAANLGSMKGVYDATRNLCNDWRRNITMVKDKVGKLLTKDDDVRKRWRNRFAEVLNRPVPTDKADVMHETPALRRSRLVPSKKKKLERLSET